MELSREFLAEGYSEEEFPYTLLGVHEDLGYLTASCQ
jgi:hypothetical protein